MSLEAGKYDTVNNGQNIVKPLTRLDLRMKYETGVDKQNGNAAIATVRMDKVIEFQDEWELAFRLDVPYWWYRCTSHSQDNCYDSNDMGDTLLQILVVPPAFGSWIVAFGSKFLFPTAGDNLEVGDAKYQVMPTFAFGYDIAEWRSGSFWGLLVRHAFDVAGYASAPHINRTYIQPTLNVMLPEEWFITFSPELCYDWEVPGWFIPFDVTFGKMVTKNTVVTLEYEVALMRQYKEYRQLVEFRIGFFF
jgi:hypothetical protein